MVSSAMMEVGRYAVQEVRNYLSGYESSAAMVQQMLANLEQQAILDFSRVEATIQQMFQQFLPQAPFSNPNEHTPRAQSSATKSGQPQALFSNSNETNPRVQASSVDQEQLRGQKLIVQASNDQPIASPGVFVASTDSIFPDGGPGGQNGGFTPQQISQAYGFNQITFDNGTIKGDGSGQTIAIVDAYSQPNIVSDLSTFDSQYGLPAPPSFNIVNQTGGSSLPPSDTSQGNRI